VKGDNGEDEDDGEGEHDDGITVNEKSERGKQFEKVEASRRIPEAKTSKRASAIGFHH
jgi:hypothetical protein